MPKRRFANPHVYDYQREMKSVLATTRFNDQTWKENQSFLQTAREQGQISSHVRCIYAGSEPISQYIWAERPVMVLEMNNQINQIVGIGLILNHPICHKYQVYDHPKYNTYAYLGKHHIDRADWTDEEGGLMTTLEQWCFRGKRHQKRMQGIKSFPVDILYDYKTSTGVDLVKEVANMFKRRFCAGGVAAS